MPAKASRQVVDVFVETPRGSRATSELDHKIIDGSRKRKKTRA